MSSRRVSRQDAISFAVLYLVSFCLFLLIAVMRADSGYMDESYYLLTARNLSEGYGFQENILWNFMDDPVGLPHPSHLYWMPLVSIIAAGGMKIAGSTYLSAVVPLTLIAALIPPVTYIAGKRWLKDQFWALVGAICALFGGYYLLYYSAVDGFSLYMLLGVAYFMAISQLFQQQTGKQLLLNGVFAGVFAGLLHLTRADGLLWAMMIPVFFAAAFFLNGKEKTHLGRYILGTACSLFVYVLLLAPWFYRNIQLSGSLTAAGSSHSMFLTQYNELFVYPTSTLTFSRWIDSGLGELLRHRLNAAGTNLLSLLGVQLLIIQLPFAIIGIRKHWKSSWVKVNVFGLVLLFLFLTVIFPFAGQRGSYFHSNTAFQIFLWVMSVIGLREAASRLPLKEGLDRNLFEKFIGISFLVLLLLVTVVLSGSKIDGLRAGVDEMEQIVITLQELEIGQDEIILINDPATLNWVSERPAVVIPGGDETMMLAVMEHYGVHYVVLQYNHPPELADLYKNPLESENFSVLATEDTWYVLELAQ